MMLYSIGTEGLSLLHLSGSISLSLSLPFHTHPFLSSYRDLPQSDKETKLDRDDSSLPLLPFPLGVLLTKRTSHDSRDRYRHFPRLASRKPIFLLPPLYPRSSSILHPTILVGHDSTCFPLPMMQWAHAIRTLQH